MMENHEFKCEVVLQWKIDFNFWYSIRMESLNVTMNTTFHDETMNDSIDMAHNGPKFRNGLHSAIKKPKSPVHDEYV